MTSLNKYQGTLIGSAVGDALGMPLEFLNQRVIKNRYGGIVTDYVAPSTNHACSHLKPGQYTDDTQMTLALAKAILDKGEFCPHSFKRRLIEWYECDDHRAPGIACLESVARLNNGISYKESGKIEGAGNGSAMRVSPIGLVHSGPELVKHSYTQSLMTHNDKRASIGSIITAYIVNRLLPLTEDTFNREEFLTHIIKVTQSLEDKLKENKKEFSTMMNKIPQLLTLDFNEGIKSIGTSGYVIPSVNAALYSFLYSPQDYKQTIINIINQGDDADSVAAIAGAFSGALNGIESIPKTLVERLEGKDEIIDIANRLYEIRK